jgi:RNA polymerase sigma factor (sigma-70 family)
MVHGVGLRVLHRHQDAEDVCQATFLLLARKVNSVPWRDSVANWLYGAARRLALQARDSANRRTLHETRVKPEPPADAMADITLRELQTVLDDELARLPRKYRTPILLCCLEGKARDEAARCLGWTVAEVKNRLEEGRELLRRRLARRGLTLSAILAAVTLPSGAAAALPAMLVHTTSRAALQVLAGRATAGVVSANVATLIEAGLQTMLLTKLKVATALLLALGTVTTGIITLTFNAQVTAQALAAPAREAAPAQKSAAPVTKEPASRETAEAKPSITNEKDDAVLVSGRVVDPDGKAVAGARVFFARYILRGRDAALSPPRSPTDGDGNFRLRVPRTGYQNNSDKALWMRGAVVAVGKGFAFGWVGTQNADKLTNVTLQLHRDLPIEGRVVDLQGKAVAGVNVQMRSVSFREDDKGLKDFVEAIRANQVRLGWWNHPARPAMTLDPALLDLTRTATTGADGKFRLTGVSPECLVLLRFDGPTIETSEAYAMTRPEPTIHLPADKELLEARAYDFHGATFDRAAAPTRPIVGIVRDKDTGKPIAGVTIQHETNRGPGDVLDLRATTDAEGRYRMVGLSRDAGHPLLAVPPPGTPYLRAALRSGAAAGLEPVTVDFTLKRGVVIRGRVTEKETGRPMAALVEYFAFGDNPNLREAPGYRDSHSLKVRTGEDGSFAVLGLPGHGLIAAKAADQEKEGRYIMAVGADKIKGRREHDDFITHPYICNASRYNTLVEVYPPKGAESIVEHIVFHTGKTVTGTIVDPDGRPMQGASIDSAFGVWFHVKDLPAAQFGISGVDPKHPRSFFFRDRGQKLVAAVIFKGNEPMPVTVHLQKCATITGRLVDEDGLPCVAWIMGSIHPGQLNNGVGIGNLNGTMDKDGRFRIEGVVPGLKVALWAGKTYYQFDQKLIPELTLQAGEVKDLGDLKRKPTE